MLPMCRLVPSMIASRCDALVSFSYAASTKARTVWRVCSTHRVSRYRLTSGSRNHSTYRCVQSYPARSGRSLTEFVRSKSSHRLWTRCGRRLLRRPALDVTLQSAIARLVAAVRSGCKVGSRSYAATTAARSGGGVAGSAARRRAIRSRSSRRSTVRRIHDRSRSLRTWAVR